MNDDVAKMGKMQLNVSKMTIPKYGVWSKKHHE